VSADSHVAIPVDERDLDAILDDDALPYRWIGDALSSVMPAHVIYPEVDDRPAGFSPVWLRDILRGRLGYRRRHLQRRSVDGRRERRRRRSVGGTAALRAGCDMVLVCNDGRRTDALLDGLKDERDPESHRRLAALRAAPLDPRADPRYPRAIATLAAAGLIAQ